LFYEKTVNSFSKLVREAELLDLDSGIRSYVTYNGRKSFVFITRSARGYTLMIYGRKGRGPNESPEGRLFVKEFPTEKELMDFVEGIVERPIKAFVY
jgi:hypothetical protein